MRAARHFLGKAPGRNPGPADSSEVALHGNQESLLARPMQERECPRKKLSLDRLMSDTEKLDRLLAEVSRLLEHFSK
jgi:hypothetical protein